MPDTEILKMVRQSLEIERDTLQSFLNRLDDTVAQAARLLYDTKGQVIITGMGKAGLIGRKIASTFASTGTPSYFLHPAEAIHGDLGIVSEREVVLAISNSGETDEIVALLPHIKRLGARTLALTGKPRSTLGLHSDVVIDTSVEKEADPLDIAPTASTTLMLAVGDALAAALVQMRGFSRDQYAIFHPGGSLGRKLLLLVRDLMHQGDAMPCIPHTATFHEALFNMTTKRLGCTFILDQAGRLDGIITDGDLRRIIQKNGLAMDAPVQDVMVQNPKRIHEEQLAAEALKLMEDHAITVLPVVDSTEKPVGAIHMHDLIKAGLA